ncbi:MAG: hypothetical protein ACLSCV_01780 [Acutalibacteraceae bacterium]
MVWGEESSHVIFDIAVPFEFEYTDEQLESIISDKIKELDDSYSVTLVVDHEGNLQMMKPKWLHLFYTIYKRTARKTGCPFYLNILIF